MVLRILGRALRWTLFALVLGSTGLLWQIGSKAVRPAPAPIPERALGLPHEQVSFASASRSLIHGWYVPGDGKTGTVVLMHGARSNRLSMVGRAQFLHRRGYSVLLFDFQGHGQSRGRHITMGYLESRDAAAAVAYARSRERPGGFVAAIGASMGGAAALLGKEPLPVDALVLEAVYPDIEHALGNRLVIRYGRKGRLLEPFLLAQLCPRLGIGTHSLAPVEGIRHAQAPVLLIAGAQDRRTPVTESQALFDAAPEPKALWVVKGAGHVDFANYAGAAYERRVLAFLAHARADAAMRRASLHDPRETARGA